MNLDEFKKTFESDATKRCEAQEETIKQLHTKVRKLEENIDLLQKDKTQLMNRCYVMGKGILCIFCGFRDECKARKETR